MLADHFRWWRAAAAHRASLRFAVTMLCIYAVFYRLAQWIEFDRYFEDEQV